MKLVFMRQYERLKYKGKLPLRRACVTGKMGLKRLVARFGVMTRLGG